MGEQFLAWHRLCHRGGGKFKVLTSIPVPPPSGGQKINYRHQNPPGVRTPDPNFLKKSLAVTTIVLQNI